jgi:hypothetical protein
MPAAEIRSTAHRQARQLSGGKLDHHQGADLQIVVAGKAGKPRCEAVPSGRRSVSYRTSGELLSTGPLTASRPPQDSRRIQVQEDLELAPKQIRNNRNVS